MRVADTVIVSAQGNAQNFFLTSYYSPTLSSIVSLEETKLWRTRASETFAKWELRDWIRNFFGSLQEEIITFPFSTKLLAAAVLPHPLCRSVCVACSRWKTFFIFFQFSMFSFFSLFSLVLVIINMGDTSRRSERGDFFVSFLFWKFHLMNGVDMIWNKRCTSKKKKKVGKLTWISAWKSYSSSLVEKDVL